MGDLKIDTWMSGFSPAMGDIAREDEARGVDGVWVTETGHDPFLASFLIADRTEDVEFGTRIATAFSRSPMVTAASAWDLADYSDGRFVLGLGTQVKAHNERRFSVEWDSPGPRLREVIESLRHIWDVWQHDEELDYEGEFYSFSLMSEYFDPGPIDHPKIPIHISGLNEYNIRLAGELCDGLALHPFNSPSFIEEVVHDWVREGAERGNRSLDDVEVSASPFLITGRTDEEIEESRREVRQRVAFYGSTPSYRGVLEHHGWGDLGETLHELSRDQRWAEMAEHVTDEILYTFAVEAPARDIEDEVRRRYADIVDRAVVSADPEGKREVADGLYVKA